MAHSLVIGGSGGIGALIVRRFAARGDDVVFTWFRARESAERLECECAPLAGSVARRRLDVRDVEHVGDVVAGCGDELRTIVFAAASGVTRSIADVRPRHVDFTFAINVRGLVATYQAGYRALAANGGSLVGFTSTGSQVVIPGYGITGASKAATEALVRYMAVEAAADGIRVNVICASAVDTKALRAILGSHFDSFMKAAETPLGGHVQPEDIADAVDWLVSPAARMVTGQIITVDGGLSVAGAGPAPDRSQVPIAIA